MHPIFALDACLYPLLPSFPQWSEERGEKRRWKIQCIVHFLLQKQVAPLRSHQKIFVLKMDIWRHILRDEFRVTHQDV